MPTPSNQSKPHKPSNNGWSAERRQKQSEKIKLWQPWLKSTGAKTIEGKAISSRNADKGKGKRAREVRALLAEAKALLKSQRDFMSLL